MRTGIRLGGAAAFACATALGIAACGSSGSTSTGAGNGTAQTNNENFGYVNDPHVQSELAKLNAVPATKLASVACQWRALDEYVANNAYVLSYGSEQLPQFLSNRLNFKTAIFHPLYLNDWTSWQLKK